MSKYFILIICFAILIGAFTLKESKFTYVRTIADKPILVKDKTATVLYVGDIMLGRNVEKLMNENGKNYPFEHVKALLADADTVVANLEGPILEPHNQAPSGSLRFNFASTTPSLLTGHNIKLVSIANNHTGDFGTDGYNQTANFLDKTGIEHAGHPFAFGEQYTVHTQVADQKVFYVAFNLTNPNLDIQKALDFVKQLPRSKDEFFVAMVHGGTEYKPTSDARQQKFYRGLIDAGVDVVIAHHPHVVEEVELYHKKPIFYSLGNFIFDQYFSPEVQDELSVKLTLSAEEAKYELIPIKSIRSQPEVLAEAEKSAWLKAYSDKASADIKDSVVQGSFVIPR